MINLFIAILNMSLIASFVALGVILIRIPLKKAPKVFSYALWAVVLFKLLCPFTIETTLSLVPVKAEPVPQNIIYSQTPSIDSGISFVDNSINRAIKNTVPPANPATSINPMQIILFALSCIWLAGIAVLLLYSLVSYFRLKYRVRMVIPVRENIYETDRIKTAFVLGFVHPKIYVPVGLSEQEIDYILKHEQTHIRRRDYLIKPLAFIAVCVHWFNPVIWFSYYLAMRDMELSCDESVLKHYGSDIRRDYSNSLLSLSVKQSGLISPLAFVETGVKDRIKNVLNYKKPAVWISAAAITAVVVAAVLLLPHAVQDPKDISDEQIIEAIKNTAYFCYGELSGGFSDVSQIPVGNLFNLYASTKEVQDKMNALTSSEHYAEIPMTDFKAFVQKSFGNYQFAPEQFEEQLSGRVRFNSTDTEKKVIMLAGINGGVLWPGAVPYGITLENVAKDHGRIKVTATIHTTYDNVNIDGYYKVEMQLLETKDGYNYVSYIRNELSDELSENITLEYSDESGVYTENYIKKTTGDSVTLLTEDGKEIISGEDVIPLPYVYAVKINGKYDLRDKVTHAKVSNISYDEIFCEKYPDGRLSTRIMKGRAGKYWGLISADGKTLTNPQNQTFEDIQIATYEEVWPIIPVIEDGKYGAIDYKGKVVIKAEWGYLAMDVYNIPNTVFVFDGSKWGGIKLDKNLLASAVDYSLTPPEWFVENYKQTLLAQASVDSAQLASMFDFAIKYRFDYIPFFAEGNAPQSSGAYLFYAFAINLDNWGTDKGTMSKTYVENVIKTHFEAKTIVHEALSKGWNFDGENYTAVPSGIRDKPIYVLTGLKVSVKDGKTVYEVALDYCNLANGNIASDGDMVKIREEISNGDYSSLVSLQRETFTYYLGDNGEPVFIAHVMTDRPEMKWYYQMFRNDAAFRILGSKSGDITDDQMATYAILKMDHYSYEDGNTKEEYNAITQKHFGRNIANFNNGSTETIPGTNKIRATGWSYNNGMYVIVKDIRDNGDGSMTGDFYCVDISDSHWTGKTGEFEEAESALLNGDISSFADCDISIKRVVFEVKTENGKQYFKYRSVKNLEENVKSIVLYSK
jgi:beta-lactamase regulating signal transducer with metallopeptidase domain